VEAARNGGATEDDRASVNSLLQRARKNLDSAPPEADRRRIATKRKRCAATSRYGRRETSTRSQPCSHTTPFYRCRAGGLVHRRTAIQRFFERARATSRGYRFVGVRANGAPAVAVYVRSPDDVEYRASGITVLCMREGLITQVTRFVMPYLFPRFGLPSECPATGPEISTSRHHDPSWGARGSTRTVLAGSR